MFVSYRQDLFGEIKLFESNILYTLFSNFDIVTEGFFS